MCAGVAIDSTSVQLRSRLADTELRFDSLERSDDPRLLAVLAEILVGSRDAHDIDALRRADLQTVAAETAEEYLEFDPFDSMFLAIEPSGEVVGLVIGDLRSSSETGTASFIGGTDDDNFPMAAAFTKVGYPNTESRIDLVRDL